MKGDSISNEMAKILVVDDEPRIVESTSLFLESWGYKAAGVLSGIEAIDAVKERHLIWFSSISH